VPAAGNAANAFEMFSARSQAAVATIYQHLGIDAAALTLRNKTGRPIAALPDGCPIPELTAGTA
jgi:hypothetical protein